MKNPMNKNRTKIEDLAELQGSVEQKELGHNQLRLVTGGLTRYPQPCSCTKDNDEDCD